jgi:hypothetical protein
MAKKLVIGAIGVFVVWFVLDAVIHMVLLKPLYEATQQLWRPMAEYKFGLGIAVGIVAATAVAAVYVKLIAPKSMAAALQYGGLLGIAWGVSFGPGIYCFMPIPLDLAIYWAVGVLVECLAAGVVLGLLVKD